MRFTIEHIEELIFDYHEGNLSEAEKAKVLNLIHQYPEYAAEFTLWAQTYAHVDNVLPDYGLTENLIQQPVVAVTNWYNTTWAKLGALSSALLIAVVSFYFFGNNENTKPTANTKVINPVVEKEATSVIVTSKSNKIEAKKLLNKSTENTLKSTDNQIVNTISAPLSTPNIEQEKQTIVPQEKTVEVPQIEEVKNIVSKVDLNSVSQTKNADPKAENDSPNKNKKKKSFNFKPSTNFIPVNTDF